MNDTYEIRCDREGCNSIIFVPNKIDEDQATQVARTVGWAAQIGAHRWYHHCLKCRAVKR